jgi:hypothetical protein
MRPGLSAAMLAALFAGLSCLGTASSCCAGDLTIDLGKAEGVTFVGAIRRLTSDGRLSKPVDPKAKIDAPVVDAQAEKTRGGWIFRGLPPGSYDLVILARGNVRVEGFQYPPIDEFDPVFAPDTKAPEDEVRDDVVEKIVTSKHYENKVVPLFLAGSEKQVRVLVQLVRDKETSYDADYGKPVATVRHEIWQFTRHTGAWVKDKKTVVLDRVLLARDDFARRTWVWDPKLGAIAVGKPPKAVTYELPDRFDPETAKGWFPTK